MPTARRHDYQVDSKTRHDVPRGILLGHVAPYGGVLAYQHHPKKFNMYQPLIEVYIQPWAISLRGKEKNTRATAWWMRVRWERVKSECGYHGEMVRHNNTTTMWEEKVRGEGKMRDDFKFVDRVVFKMVFVGTNMLELTPNLMRLLLWVL
jgi:hypothetical protein